MLFDKIITLSLNPVADITLYVDGFIMGSENNVTSELYDSAGKAVDVSRVLQSYELANTALIVAGQENSKRYFERLTTSMSGRGSSSRPVGCARTSASSPRTAPSPG